MLQPIQIPTTGRKVEFQIKQLGFNSLQDFALSLPQNAVVADVGAGLSRLGHEVAALRPDITWVNIDPSYKDEGIWQAVSENLPQNVRLFAGNIVEGFELPAELRSGADLVYSYWLLPHLSLEDDTPARTACSNLFDLLKPQGQLVVGPIRHWGIGLFSPIRYKGTARYAAEDFSQATIDDIIKKTKLWWLARMILLVSDRHRIHLVSKFVGGKTKSA